jgi:hypothetical protein
MHVTSRPLEGRRSTHAAHAEFVPDLRLDAQDTVAFRIVWLTGEKHRNAGAPPHLVGVEDVHEQPITVTVTLAHACGADVDQHEACRLIGMRQLMTDVLLL